MLAMGLNTEEEGSAMAFLRRGYKVVPQYCMLGIESVRRLCSCSVHARGRWKAPYCILASLLRIQCHVQELIQES